jgi:hypothetical protein
VDDEGCASLDENGKLGLTMKNIIVVTFLLMLFACKQSSSTESPLFYFPESIDELKRNGYVENPREEGSYGKALGNNAVMVFRFPPNGTGFEKSIAYKFRQQLDQEAMLKYLSDVSPGYKKGLSELVINSKGREYKYRVALLPDNSALYLSYVSPDYSKN